MRAMSRLHTLIAVLCALILSGCDVGTNDAADSDVADDPGLFAPQPLPGLVESNETPPPMALPEVVATDDASLSPAHAQLVGTSWVFGEITITFKSGTTAFVQGGRVATLAPEGVDGHYTLADGKISLDVMGETMSGTWDGESLVIDGAPGQGIEKQ